MALGGTIRPDSDVNQGRTVYRGLSLSVHIRFRPTPLRLGSGDPPGHIRLTYSTRTVRLDNSPSFCVGDSPFNHHHPPIYGIKRSAGNVCKIDTGRSVRAMQEYGLVPVLKFSL